jgi:hypothetical protein
MKKLFLLLLTTISLTAFAQEPKIKLSSDTTRLNVNGTVIMKGDEFIVPVLLNGNGNTTSRSLYFDFEYQNTAFELINITHTGTGGNGGVLPAGSTITLDTYQYPGYRWVPNQNNMSANGNQNYQNANYNFTSAGPKTIIRSYLNWATPNGLPFNSYDQLLRLRFRLKTTAAGDSWDPIKMNFAASFNQNGSTGAAINEVPITSVVTLNPDATKLVKASIDLNGNVTNTHLKVLFKKADNSGPMFDVATNGAVNIVDSLLTPNTEYQIMVMANMDQIVNYSNAAVTISDFTTAVQEFASQNLNGTYNNQNIQTGMGYWAADINGSNSLDGGDAPRLLSSVAGVASLVNLPQGYTAGSNGWMSLPTFKASEFNSVTPSNVFATLPKSQPPVYTYTTTANRGTPETISLKYLFRGDINRSHSSQVVVNGSIATNAIPSLNKSLFKLAQINPTKNLTINPSPTTASSVDVNLKNLTVTSNSIEIPINIDTKGVDVSAIQFELAYDATKLKFETIGLDIPTEWYSFVAPSEGRVKFGALDQKLKKTINGSLVPFKVKFTALQNGLNINSFVKVTQTVDAADKNGNQLGVNLNTETIKLTGYNNF